MRDSLTSAAVSTAQPEWMRWDDEPYWSAWSRASVRLMQSRNAAMIRDFGLQGRSYRWTMKEPCLTFSGPSPVLADLCVVGCASATEGTFLWAWANETIPACACGGLERVREFGEINGLDLLTTPETPATRPQAFELAAVAARILNAGAVWVEPSGDLTLYLALSNLRRG